MKRTVTPQEVPCRVVDDKGRRPPAQDSVPSIYVVVVVAAFAAPIARFGIHMTSNYGIAYHVFCDGSMLLPLNPRLS